MASGQATKFSDDQLGIFRGGELWRPLPTQRLTMSGRTPHDASAGAPTWLSDHRSAFPALVISISATVSHDQHKSKRPFGVWRCAVVGAAPQTSQFTLASLARNMYPEL